MTSVERPKVLLTCPPMLGMVEEFAAEFEKRNLDFFAAETQQVLSEEQLKELLPQYDGWILGDDPATRAVFEAGRQGKLKAAIKWGIGVDNVDFAAAKDLSIPITNTPQMFGGEVADLAMHYVTALARESFTIDRGVRQGQWPKPAGISLAQRKVGIVGGGDIGSALTRRCLAADLEVCVYDPAWQSLPSQWQNAQVELKSWPEGLAELDFLVFTCALTASNRHMFNAALMEQCQPQLRVVNVARGPLIEEAALARALTEGRIHSAALDVFEEEPLPSNSPLREQAERCIFSSHNGSNTQDAVRRTSLKAIALLHEYLLAADNTR